MRFRAVLRWVSGTLVVIGRIYLYVPSSPGAEAAGDPPPGHPERLRPDVPLTDVERALQRDLST
ncbi:DUF6059 family protein, partial [Streptomyces sp. NPDC056049]|uniref:DUF6059 family protein n=1 Tax=Streptomyces sp. NPDC056049 TaxID=3345693 RepID=UPI0035D789C2